MRWCVRSCQNRQTPFAGFFFSVSTKTWTPTKRSMPYLNIPYTVNVPERWFPFLFTRAKNAIRLNNFLTRSTSTFGFVVLPPSIAYFVFAPVLQDGSRLTALLQSSLAMSGVEEGCGAGRRRDARAAVGSTGGPAVGAGKDSGGWLRSPVAGSDRPLLEHFLVECRLEVVREWRREGGGGQRRGGGQRASSAANASAVADRGDGCAAFPLARDGRCVDLRAFSCLQVRASRRLTCWGRGLCASLSANVHATPTHAARPPARCLATSWLEHGGVEAPRR